MKMCMFHVNLTTRGSSTTDLPDHFPYSETFLTAIRCSTPPPPIVDGSQHNQRPWKFIVGR